MVVHGAAAQLAGNGGLTHSLPRLGRCEAARTVPYPETRSSTHHAHCAGQRTLIDLIWCERREEHVLPCAFCDCSNAGEQLYTHRTASGGDIVARWRSSVAQPQACIENKTVWMLACNRFAAPCRRTCTCTPTTCTTALTTSLTTAFVFHCGSQHATHFFTPPTASNGEP